MADTLTYLSLGFFASGLIVWLLALLLFLFAWFQGGRRDPME